MDISVLDTVANISNCLAGVFLLGSLFKKKDNSAQALLALWTAVLLKKKEERENAALNKALSDAKKCLPELTEVLTRDENCAKTIKPAVDQSVVQVESVSDKTSVEQPVVRPVVGNTVSLTPTILFSKQNYRSVA